MQEKEKLLVTCNYSLSHNVFYPIREFSAIFIKPEIVVCKHSVWTSLKFVIWEKVNALPNDKFLDCSILKAFTDYKINVA